MLHRFLKEDPFEKRKKTKSGGHEAIIIVQREYRSKLLQ